MSVSNLTIGCKDATFTLSNRDLCILQVACMDRITNLREFIKVAEFRKDEQAQARLKGQVDQVEDLLARLVQL